MNERSSVIDDGMKSEDELNRFFALTLDLFCIADTDGYFRRLNPAWEKTLGYSLDELTGKRFVELIHPDDVAPTLEAVSALSAQNVVVNFVNRYRCKDGSYRYIEWRSAPAGKLIYAAARDITERIQMEEALHQANRKLHLLGSITRHDILNQLTLLRGFLEIAEESVKDEVALRSLAHVKKASVSVEKLIEFTSDYQELGVKRPQWTDLSQAMMHIQTVLLPGSVSLSNDLEGLEVYSDPMIEKVFYNLVENSLRHGGHVTAIRCHYRKQEDGLTIVYEDDGEGVKSSDKEMIFEKGYGRHTGYGMYLSRAILGITEMTISEKGEHGKGARFEISVPIGRYRITSPRTPR